MHQIGYMSERPKWLLAEDVVSTNLSSWASNSRREQLRGDVFYVVYGQSTLWKLANRHGANRTWIPRLKLRTRLPRLFRLSVSEYGSRTVWCSFDHGTRSVKEKGTEHLGGNSWIFMCTLWIWMVIVASFDLKTCLIRLVISRKDHRRQSISSINFFAAIHLPSSIKQRVFNNQLTLISMYGVNRCV
jgi:hypothetical protein